MATKPKERDLQVKEKRGTSPSFPRPSNPTQQRRKSPTPAAAQKQVPNYLKPTQSTSRPDPNSSKPTTKKQPLTDKPNHLTRRRSFDKPPSPSRIPKPQTSTTSPNSLRSSSFSAKTNPLQKAQLEKLTKGTKDVGKNSSLQQPRASNVRKVNTATTTNIKKQNNASSSMTNITKNGTKMISAQSTVIDSSKPEPEEKYEESLPAEAEEIDEKNITVDIHKPEEDKEHNEDIINEDEFEFEEGKEQINACESSTITEDHSVPLSENKEEIYQPETDQTPAEDNGSNNDQELEENKKEESSDDTLAGEEQALGEEKKEVREEDASLSSKEEIEGNKEAAKSEELPQVEKVSKGWKAKDAESSVVKKSQGGPQGKKDTAAYNDVIEETASKLREQRKNKVKALVGAFETVISLESETTSE